VTSRAAEQFARVIIEMAPYVDEIVEIVRHPRLGAKVFEELPALRARHPEEHARWIQEIEIVLATPAVLNDVAEELSLHGRSLGPPDAIVRSVSAWFRRLLAEG
jgi:hypothetical protein